MDALLPLEPEARQRELKRRARKRYKDKHRNSPEYKAARQRMHRNRAARNVLEQSTIPFVGCDGEGAGVDDLGRQQYMLLRIGKAELITGSPLTTEQCLDFILAAPRNAILVGFAFGYDVTMILRDLTFDHLDRLFKPEDNKRSFTYWRDYAIDYLPKQHFKVARLRKVIRQNKETYEVIKGSARTIYETFGFFQCSFVKALENFNVCSNAELDQIKAGKAVRGETLIDDTARAYCAMEVEALAVLLTKLRDACHSCGIVPRTWSGAGKLATALHKQHDTPKLNDLVVSDSLLLAAQSAYFGGRFEVFRTGLVQGPIYAYDINSAYPSAMLKLPCLLHGTWKLQRGDDIPDGEHFLSYVKFDAPPDATLCAFPTRPKTLRLYWGTRGQGWFWSPEIRSGLRLGHRLQHVKSYVYERHCDCQPFHWVKALYEQRKALGKATVGYPIKLAINSLYGKLAQRVGSRTWYNPFWAGLITSYTRAALADALAPNPSAAIMLATDGIFSTAPLDLPIGGALGEWEASVYDSIFIVQPGLYWTPDVLKSRGTPRGILAPHRERFEGAWAAFMQRIQRNPQFLSTDIPALDVELTVFTGLKLAWSRDRKGLNGTWRKAGMWSEVQRRISFDWRAKRVLGGIGTTAISLAPIAPDSYCKSVAYTDANAAAIAEALSALATDGNLPDWQEGAPDFMELI